VVVADGVSIVLKVDTVTAENTQSEPGLGMVKRRVEVGHRLEGADGGAAHAPLHSRPCEIHSAAAAGPRFSKSSHRRRAGM